MDSANTSEAVREAMLDLEERAYLLMGKTAISYLRYNSSSAAVFHPSNCGVSGER